MAGKLVFKYYEIYLIFFLSLIWSGQWWFYFWIIL